MTSEEYIEGLEGCPWARRCIVEGCNSPVVGLYGDFCAKHRMEEENEKESYSKKSQGGKINHGKHKRRSNGV